MKVHYLAINRIFHLDYAMVAIRSVIERGGVAPSDVVLSVSPLLIGATLRAFQARYPIHVRELGHPCCINKCFILNQVFEEFPETNKIVQVDADTAITQDVDFLGLMDSIGGDVGAYTYMNALVKTVFQHRAPQTLAEMRYSIQGPPKQRYEAFLQATFGFTLEEFIAWVQTEGWIYGGLFVVDRKLTAKPVWKKMVAFASICFCDETIIQLGRFATACGHQNLDFRPINLPNFKQVICPAELDFNDPRGMVHWANPQYRQDNPIHRAKIEEQVNKTLKIIFSENSNS